jgi:threonine/homoserine/homoserine lactone efflux protein
MISFNLTGYLLFALVTSITPGPNNYMLFSYGKSYGFKNSTWLMLGIFTGFSVLLYVSAYGMAEMFTRNLLLAQILKIVSSLWLLYLAFALRKLNSGTTPVSASKKGFLQGFFLQFINPKAWIMAITGAGAFLPQMQNMHLSVFLFTFTFGLVGIPCMIAWISFGDMISKVLKSEIANRAMGWILFFLMLLCIITIWI